MAKIHLRIKVPVHSRAVRLPGHYVGALWRVYYPIIRESLPDLVGDHRVALRPEAVAPQQQCPEGLCHLHRATVIQEAGVPGKQSGSTQSRCRSSREAEGDWNTTHRQLPGETADTWKSALITACNNLKMSIYQEENYFKTFLIINTTQCLVSTKMYYQFSAQYYETLVPISCSLILRLYSTSGFFRVDNVSPRLLYSYKIKS